MPPRFPGIKPARKRKPPFMRAIERTPEVRRRELMWGGRAGKLERLKTTGTRGMVTLDMDLLNSFFIVHQHLTKRGVTVALASVEDIETLSEIKRMERARAGVIASMNGKGKAIGYVIYTLDRPVYPGDIFDLANYVDKKIFSTVRIKGKSRRVKNSNRVYDDALTEFLESRGYKLGQTIVPMPEYVFDKMKCAFVRKNGRK